MPTIEDARLWYLPGDVVHGFDHVLRVMRLADLLAQAEGADREIVRVAALLHDAHPPAESRAAANKSTAEERADHHISSAELARQVLQAEGWPDERIAAVQHAIRAHRFRRCDELPQTVEAQVLYDADKLDAIGATGVARAIAYAACHGQPAFYPPSQTFLTEGRTEPGEPHSAYHEYVYKLARIRNRLHTRTATALAEERHHLMAEFFENLAQDGLDPDHLTILQEES